MKTSIYAIIAVLAATIFGGIGALLLKKGADKVKINLWKLIKNYHLLSGVISYGLATIIFIPALKYGELSVLFPIIATSYIWVSIASPIFFSTDSMNLIKWFAIAFIAIGVIFIGVGSHD